MNLKSKISVKEINFYINNLNNPTDESAFTCFYCNKHFTLTKYDLQKKRFACKQNNKKYYILYCSRICASRQHKIDNMQGTYLVYCEHCKKEFYKNSNQIIKTDHDFCSQHCWAVYSNSLMKPRSARQRSKFESYAEKELRRRYKGMRISFNNRKIVAPYELDIYIPKLKVAFEINGIFHYKPIYGEDKLLHTQSKERKKRYICNKKGIKLHVINISRLKNFSEQEAYKYLKRIFKFIDKYKIEKL